MMTHRIWLAFAAFLLSMLGMSGQAHAACNALSLCSCTTTATGVSFGNYDPTSSANLDSAGSVRVQCTLLVALAGSYTIDLSTGAGTYAQRLMKQGTSSLAYNLYTDSPRSQIWGNGTGGSSRVTNGFTALLTLDQTTTVYGRVTGAQNVSAGVYGDTIIVTVTY